MAAALAYLARQHWLLKQKLLSGDDQPRDEMLSCKLSSTGVGDISEKHASVDQPPSSPGASSVWCWGDQHTDRICRFHNLYYLPNKEQFAFLHGEDSVYVELPINRFDPALLDLSSVRDHNVNYFNYMDMLYSKSHQVLDNVQVVRGKSLVFRRFHPENLMHVIHDDLLPMFHTLVTMDTEYITKMSSFELEPFDVHLVLMDGRNPGPFRELYESFTSFAPLYSKDLHTSEQPICFTDAIVGLSKHTTWYQYGFAEPQGPIRNHNVTSWDLRRFGRFVKSRLKIGEPEEHDEPNTQTTVLLTRKSNRLILNEFDLTLALAQSLHMKVITMAIETHSLTDMITALSMATVLIGMHGSLLSLALFLPPGSMLVELFPYAVNPEHYTPYKTLVSLPGMEVEYVAWRNLDVRKSVTHVDRTWDQGGIAHLRLEEQQRILNSTEVPRHLCCRDPEWLFRIYQDTAVDIEAVIQLIQSKFQHLANPSTSTEKESTASPQTGIQTSRIFPSYVNDITCSPSDNSSPTSLFITWKPPVNLEFIGYQSIRYEVWIQELGVDDYMAWILSKTSHRFSAADIRPAVSYNIWIRCLMDDLVGPFNLNNVTCTT